MPDYLWFTTQAGRTALTTYAKSLKSIGVKNLLPQARMTATKTAGETFLKNTFKEIGEEVLDFVLNDIIQQQFVANRSSELFDKQKQNEVVMGTLLMVALPGTYRTFKDYSQVRNFVINDVFNDTAKLYNELVKSKKPLDTEIARLEKKSIRTKEENEYLKILKNEQDLHTKAIQEVNNIVNVIRVDPEYITTETVDLMKKKKEILKKKK